MPLYVLDSDSCIYALNRTRPLLVQRIMECEPGELGTTAITAAELRFGMLNSARPETNLARFEAFLSQLVVIDFGDACARHYAQIRLDLSRRGQLIGPLDMLIAAATRATGAVLITNNEREFSRVPGLDWENWSNPTQG